MYDHLIRTVESTIIWLNMDALRSSYGDSSSYSIFNSPPEVSASAYQSDASLVAAGSLLPPPLLTPENLPNTLDRLQTGQPFRIRSFPHVEGNYALHVYIPVRIPVPTRKQLVSFLGRVSSHVPHLHVVDVDIPLAILSNDDQRFEQVVGRKFHVSLGRTVPIRAHQIDSVVTMLRQKLQGQKQYWIDFNKWEVFVNDDHSRTFLSIEVTLGGRDEITRQIQAVNDVYRRHNLPEFYKNPRPHISVAWALGDISHLLRRVIGEETKKRHHLGPLQRQIFTTKFSGVKCRIGKKTYKVCKVPEE